jgi:hypothetical protein
LNPSTEDASQEKMVFTDAEKYIRDGIEYPVVYQVVITCEAPEPEPKIPEPGDPGDPGWVSYTMKFTVAKPAHDIKIRNIKISPHSKAGKALVKKS